ncbi:MAG: hypothetical protein QM776_06955 [Rhodocyclaceae bacterium]
MLGIVEATQREFDADAARAFLHAQHGRCDGEADRCARQCAVAEAGPLGLRGIEYTAQTVGRVGDGCEVEAFVVAMHAVQGGDLAGVDDHVAHGLVDQLDTAGILAAGETLIRGDGEWRNVLLQFDDEVRVIGLRSARHEAQHALELEVHVARGEVVEQRLRLAIQLEEAGQQTEVWRHAAFFVSQQGFVAAACCGRGNEAAPVTARFGWIVVVEAHQRGLLARFGEQVGGAARVDLEKGRVELGRRAVGLRLPQLRDHVLHNGFRAHEDAPATEPRTSLLSVR